MRKRDAKPQDRSALSEVRLRTGLKLSELLIFHQDRKLHYTWIANPALGATEQTLIGRTDAEVLGRTAARPLTAIKRRVLRTGRGERQEIWVTHRERTGCFDLIVEPELGRDGRITGIICAAADITHRKRAQAERDEAHRALGRLTDHVQDRIERQRRELAREVHDDIGARLTGIRMRLDALSVRTRDARLDDVLTDIDQALGATRALCAQLRPPMLDDLGVAETVRWYVRDWSQRTGVTVYVRVTPLRAQPRDPLRIDLFRMLQELLTNVARHAHASRVRVSLAPVRGMLQLRVSDNGKGFAQDAPRGFGLLGIRERLQRHRGSMHLDSTAQGTTIMLRIPDWATR